ncbi:MAG: hypothetical protein IKN74_02695 [Clostridia bacterium]|nr:hypothetical protein [Clostridia bacterium]
MEWKKVLNPTGEEFFERDFGKFKAIAMLQTLPETSAGEVIQLTMTMVDKEIDSKYGLGNHFRRVNGQQYVFGKVSLDYLRSNSSATREPTSEELSKALILIPGYGTADKALISVFPEINHWHDALNVCNCFLVSRKELGHGFYPVEVNNPFYYDRESLLGGKRYKYRVIDYMGSIVILIDGNDISWENKMLIKNSVGPKSMAVEVITYETLFMGYSALVIMPPDVAKKMYFLP